MKIALNASSSVVIPIARRSHHCSCVQFSVDVARIITNSRFISVNQSFDVARKIVKSVSFTADVARIVQKIWRYVNLGTADDLITSGTTLTNRTKAQSITGTAFYQTSREKCFDLPTTPEIWLKFDVYFNGSNRWRAYNGGANFAFCGIAKMGTFHGSTLGRLGIYGYEGNGYQKGYDVLNYDTLQTILLYLKSGKNDGVIEV